MNFAHRHRLIIALAATGFALTLLVGIGVYGLLRGPVKTGEAAPPTHATSISSPPPAHAGRPEPVRVTSNPERFVGSVAHALFRWDTRHEGDPSEWAQMLVDVADPEEAPAVASDVRRYMPSPEMWEQLSAYGTRQWLELKSIAVPGSWSTARKQAALGQIPLGAAALTVIGIRHRAGTWDTENTHTEQKVAFTLFVRCVSQEPCTLLRLSQLDRPLE